MIVLVKQKLSVSPKEQKMAAHLFCGASTQPRHNPHRYANPRAPYFGDLPLAVVRSLRKSRHYLLWLNEWPLPRLLIHQI
jgi:hypothetical protein